MAEKLFALNVARSHNLKYPCPLLHSSSHLISSHAIDPQLQPSRPPSPTPRPPSASDSSASPSSLTKNPTSHSASRRARATSYRHYGCSARYRGLYCRCRPSCLARRARLARRRLCWRCGCRGCVVVVVAAAAVDGRYCVGIRRDGRLAVAVGVAGMKGFARLV